MLECQLAEKKPYKLSYNDVVEVLINQNLAKYRYFVFTTKQAIYSALRCCRNRCSFRMMSRKQQKFQILFEQGSERLTRYLDIRNLIKT